MSMLNFTPFTATEMTDAVNKLPLAPMRFSGMFESKGVRTTEVAVELKYGRITLIADSERGAPPEHLGGRGQKREVKVLSCSHLAQADTLSPEDLQNGHRSHERTGNRGLFRQHTGPDISKQHSFCNREQKYLAQK